MAVAVVGFFTFRYDTLSECAHEIRLQNVGLYIYIETDATYIFLFTCVQWADFIHKDNQPEPAHQSFREQGNSLLSRERTKFYNFIGKTFLFLLHFGYQIMSELKIYIYWILGEVA